MIDLIRPGGTLFLFRYDTRVRLAVRRLRRSTSEQELYGGFVADGAASLNIVAGAFGGRFPVQVRFKTFATVRPFLPEEEFGPILAKNYFSHGKFSHFLSAQQVAALMRAFIPTDTAMPQRRAVADVPLRRPFRRKYRRRRLCPGFRKRQNVETSISSVEEVLCLPPLLRAMPLFNQEDAAFPIPNPPSAQETRTTICFGPLPSEMDLSMAALVRLLDERVEGRYDFVLVQQHMRQRWCYLNLRSPDDVLPFWTEFHGQSLSDLTAAQIPTHDPLNVLYWKWQGAAVLAQLFPEADHCLFEPRRCYRFVDNRPIFFYGAGQLIS